MKRLLTFVGPLFFVAAVAAHWFFGIDAFVRVLAVGMILFGIYSIVTREIPVGWEGGPPWFQLRGHAAALSGVVVLALGIFMLVFAPAAGCAMGWGRDC